MKPLPLDPSAPASITTNTNHYQHTACSFGTDLEQYTASFTSSSHLRVSKAGSLQSFMGSERVEGRRNAPGLPAAALGLKGDCSPGEPKESWRAKISTGRELECFAHGALCLQLHRAVRGVQGFEFCSCSCSSLCSRQFENKLRSGAGIRQFTVMNTSAYECSKHPAAARRSVDDSFRMDRKEFGVSQTRTAEYRVRMIHLKTLMRFKERAERAASHVAVAANSGVPVCQEVSTSSKYTYTTSITFSEPDSQGHCLVRGAEGQARCPEQQYQFSGN